MVGVFNPYEIVQDHYRTLKRFPEERVDPLLVIIFFGVPLIPAVLFIYFKIILTEGMVEILITSMSIFAALLFNLLILVYDIIRKAQNPPGEGSEREEAVRIDSHRERRETTCANAELVEEMATKKSVRVLAVSGDANIIEMEAPEEKTWAEFRRQFLQVIFSNISFAVLAAILVVILLLGWLVAEQPEGIRQLISVFVYYGTVIFLLTLFMVLKRVHILLKRDFAEATFGAEE